MLERLLAKRHITGLDLSSVRLKVIDHLGWSSEKTTQVELEYRRFLYALARKRPEYAISPPTPEVDEFWHQHILNTRRYREDCEKVFGQYMDHTPGLSSDEQSKADAHRRQVYSEYDIDFMDFDLGDSRSEQASKTEGSGAPHHSHSSHAVEGGQHGGGHDGAGHDGGSEDGGGGGHGGGDGSGGDSGGGDGGGCGGGDGGGGCGGGGCGGS
jgi:uncharacterized membrane protein YgcG